MYHGLKEPIAEPFVKWNAFTIGVIPSVFYPFFFYGHLFKTWEHIYEIPDYLRSLFPLHGVNNALVEAKIVNVDTSSVLYISVKRNAKELTELGFCPVEHFFLFSPLSVGCWQWRHWWPERCHVIAPYGQQYGCPAWLVKNRAASIQWLLAESAHIPKLDGFKHSEPSYLHLVLGRRRKSHCRYYLIDSKIALWKKINWMVSPRMKNVVHTIVLCCWVDDEKQNIF